MSGWPALQRELEAWREAGRPATFWWRDDDAVDAGPALDRLLALAARFDAPLSLAVIPADATDRLAARLASVAGQAPGQAPGHVSGHVSGHVPGQVTVLQHGYAHANHAPHGEKSMELGPHRPGVAICEELARGRAMLRAKFGQQAVPVLVPPWNRIAGACVRELTGLGFRGLSIHGPREALRPAPGVVACNTHLDVLRWRPEREFLGEAEALGLLIGHLKGRRCGAVDAAEPSGLLTHHLVMDEAAWAFVSRLLEAIARHPSARWIAAREAFRLPAAGLAE